MKRLMRPSELPRKSPVPMSVYLLLAGVVSILLSLLQTWYIQTRLGLGPEMDAFNAGQTLPTVISALIGNSLAQVIVAVLTGTNDYHQQKQDAWALLTFVGAIHSVLALLLVGTMPFWLPLFFPAFSPETRLLAMEMGCVQLIGMVANSLLIVARGIFYANQRFIVVEVAQILGYIVTLPYLTVMLPRIGPIAAAGCLVLTFLFPLLLLLPASLVAQWPDWRRPVVRDTATRMLPLIASNVVYTGDLFVERYLTGRMASGTLSAYVLSDRIYTIFWTLTNKAFIVPVTPVLTRHIQSGDLSGYYRIFWRKLTQVMGIGFLLYLSFLLFARPFLEIVFGHGRMTSDAIYTVWLFLVLRGGVFLGNNGVLLATTAFYARGETQFIARLDTVSHGLTIVAKLVLTPLSGLLGLTVVGSVQRLAHFGVQAITLWRGAKHSTSQSSSVSGGQ